MNKLEGSEEDIKSAKIVLMICILSIVVTAPLGAILISLTGPRLLTKTRQPQVLEGKHNYIFQCYLKTYLYIKNENHQVGAGLIALQSGIYLSLMKKKKKKILMMLKMETMKQLLLIQQLH